MALNYGDIRIIALTDTRNREILTWLRSLSEETLDQLRSLLAHKKQSPAGAPFVTIGGVIDDFGLDHAAPSLPDPLHRSLYLIDDDQITVPLSIDVRRPLTSESI